MKAVIGLGNPGQKYEKTRHNIGFKALDTFVTDIVNGQFTKKSQLQSEVHESQLYGEKVLFIKPLTFMNKSGDAVSKVMQYFNIQLNDVLVVHDDIALPIGAVRLRAQGSSGGHNGVDSIIKRCGADFWRLRIGIGTPPDDFDTSSFVLGRFNQSEQSDITSVITESQKLIQLFIQSKAEQTSLTINI